MTAFSPIGFSNDAIFCAIIVTSASGLSLKSPMAIIISDSESHISFKAWMAADLLISFMTILNVVVILIMRKEVTDAAYVK